MDIERVKKEVEALREAYDTVRFDKRQGEVVIKDFPFPDGWKPRRDDLLYVLPRTYPQEHPQPCLRSTMRYRNGRPQIMVKGGPRGWVQHRVEGLNKSWDPSFHSLVTMTRMIKDSLNEPHKCAPWD